MFAIFGASGASKAVQSPSGSIAADISATIQQAAPVVTGGSAPTDNDQPPTEDEEDRLIDKIGRMVEDNEKKPHHDIDDISPEEKQRQDELPRNPKKRMYEEPARDEL